MKKLLKHLRRPLTYTTNKTFYCGKWYETKRFYLIGYEIKSWKEHYQIFPFENEVYSKMFNEY